MGLPEAIWRGLAWISAVINHRLFRGRKGQTISARCWIEHRTGWELVINLILWPIERDHCRQCFQRWKP